MTFDACLCKFFQSYPRENIIALDVLLLFTFFFCMLFRSDFARLNFFGFYTVVLEKDDVLVSAASVR